MPRAGVFHTRRMHGVIQRLIEILQGALVWLTAMQRRLPRSMPRGGSEPADHGTTLGLDATLSSGTSTQHEERR